MPVVAVIGGQWGDEGKGRVVDLLAQQADVVVRYSGGNNAGHTVINELGTFKLHLVPAGVFDKEILNIIGSGVVVDLGALLDELSMLEAADVDCSKVLISDRAQIIMPYHVQQDRLQETSRGDARIGTTGRGIGPAYSDKAGRSGLRMGDLLDADRLRARLRHVLEPKNRELLALGGTGFDLETILEQIDPQVACLRSRVVSTHALLQQALERDDRVLLEGAQGALLDVDWGTYPYVTSSAPGAAGACQGAGISPRELDHVAGVFKAYCTRVGEGPFPSEISGLTEERLRERGAEYGTTTGRPRRCGWFDAVAARYVRQLNGIDQLIVTKLDVLDAEPTINICTQYLLDDQVIDYLPATVEEYSRVVPVYETLAGWQSSTADCRRWEDLPPEAQAYLKRLEAVVGARLALISIGPARDQIIEVDPIF